MEENRRSSLRERGAFPSSEARFKGVNLVPKEKVPATPGNTVVLEQSEVLRFSDRTNKYIC